MRAADGIIVFRRVAADVTAGAAVTYYFIRHYLING